MHFAAANGSPLASVVSSASGDFDVVHRVLIVLVLFFVCDIIPVFSIVFLVEGGMLQCVLLRSVRFIAWTVISESMHVV